MVLNSRRSTRWPYLLRSTLGGEGVLGFEIVSSVKLPGGAAAVREAQVDGVATLEEVFVELDTARESVLLVAGLGARTVNGAGCADGAGAGLRCEFPPPHAGGGFATTLVSRKMVSNLVTLKEDFIEANSFSNGTPSISVICPERSRSANVSSRSRA